MKVKLHKLQQGGSIIATTYQPVTVTQGAYGPSLQQAEQAIAMGFQGQQSQKQASDEPTKKDLLNAIKSMEGLPTDVNFVISKIQQDLSMSELLKDPITGQTPISITDAYLRGIQYLNQIKNSKETFDNAYKNASSKGSINEAAVTSDGNVVVSNRDSGELQVVTVQDYLNNRNNYSLKTNGDLLQLRRMDPNYKFADNILDVVENGVSTKTINEFINQFSSGLGVDTLQKEGYSKLQAQRIINGIDIIQEAQQQGVSLTGGLDGIYKTTKLTADQKKQAQEAVIALNRMLPNNYRALLALKAGNAQDPDKGVFDLITLMVDKNTSSKLQYGIDRIKEKNGKDGDGDEDGDGDLSKAKEGPAGQWFRGQGEHRTYNISLDGSKGFVVNGVVGAITKNEGKDALGTSATLQEVSQSDFKGLDVNNATFGNGIRIDSNSGNKVIVDANRLISAELPIDPNSSTPKPWLDLLKYKEDSDSILKTKYNINPDSDNLTMSQKRIVNQIYQSNHLPAKYDNQTGEMVQNKWMRFGLLKGTLTQEALMTNDVNTKYIRQITEDNEIKNYEDIRKAKNNDNKYSFDSGWFGTGISGDKLYQGTIFIPVTPSYETMTARDRTIPQQQSINQLDVANQQSLNGGTPPQMSIKQFNMFNGNQ